MPADNCSRAGYGNTHTFFQIDTTADDVFDLTVTDVYFADTSAVPYANLPRYFRILSENSSALVGGV